MCVKRGVLDEMFSYGILISLMERLIMFPKYKNVNVLGIFHFLYEEKEDRS